jgi:hypothetical protein
MNMSDETKEEKQIEQEAPKILTLKEILERKKKNMAQGKGYPGQPSNSTNHSKGTAPKGGGHKPRGHRPQGG